MTTAVEVRSGGGPDALAAAGALALSAVMTLLVPLLGAVRSADGAQTWFAPGALWVTVLPVAVTVILVARRPVAALAVAAGAGLVGVVHLLADLPVVTTPDSLARPDLYVESTDRSLPFHAAGGGYLLLAADLVAVAAGVYAALRLAGRLQFQRASDLGAASAVEGSPRSPVTAADPSSDGPLAVYDAPAPGQGPAPRRNYLLTTAGFLGVLLLAVGALTVPYQGGYLTGRYVAVGVPLTGLIAAVLLAVLAATAVLIGGSLPRSLAVALLGGVALGACLPFLTAVVAVVTAPVGLSLTVWLGLAGGVLLAAAGLLARTRMVRTRESGTETVAPSRMTAVLAGAAALAAAGLAVAAFALPPVNAPGLVSSLVLADGSALPGSTLFAAAAIPLAVAGALALVPVTALPGCAALTVLWAALVPAVTGALQLLGDEGIATALQLHLVGVGSGTWCGVAALALAGVSAVLAAVASHRAAEAASGVPDDESVAAARAVTVPLALGLGALAVVAALLPVYGTAGQIQGPTILRGYAVDAWGVWALVLATVGALAAAALSRRRWVTLTLALAAAVLQATRLVIPAGVTGAAGFDLEPGFYLQAVLVLALLAAAVVLAARTGRIREWDAAGFDAAFGAMATDRASSQSGTRAEAAASPRGRPTNRGRQVASTQRRRRKHR